MAAEFRPFTSSLRRLPFLLMENVASKNEPPTFTVHVGRGEAGERENCISLARRGVAEHEKLGDERSSLSARRDYVVVETTLLVCGTGRKKLDRFYTRECIRVDEYIYFHYVKILLSTLQNLITSNHVKKGSE